MRDQRARSADALREALSFVVIVEIRGKHVCFSHTLQSIDMISLRHVIVQQGGSMQKEPISGEHGDHAREQSDPHEAEASSQREQVRRHRMERMIALARNYRGWTVGRMNGALGRESRRAIPVSGNPKLDLVARLAQILEWDFGDVAQAVWGDDDELGPAAGTEAGHEALRQRCETSSATNASAPPRSTLSFAALDMQAQAEHRSGDVDGMKRTALAMRTIARNGHERAVAANRLAGAYDARGRYTRVLECVREGLGEHGVGADVRLMLRVNLAAANHALWNLDESRAIATSLLTDPSIESPRTRMQRVARAFCHVLRGHGDRRAMLEARDDAAFEALGASAQRELMRAKALYEELVSEFGDSQYVGLADAAAGGILEVRAAVGEIDAADAIEQVVARLERAVEAEEAGIREAPAVREAAGWWSLFGANIAVRAATRGRSGTGRGEDAVDEYERTLAICTNKASEVAEELDHWPMRERTFSLEWIRRDRAREDERRAARPRRSDLGRESMRSKSAHEHCEWTLDEEDLRNLVGAMGRFPFFRPTGWRILDRAAILAPM